MKLAGRKMNGIAGWLFGRTVESEPISDEQWEALFAPTPESPSRLGVERRREERLPHEQVGQFFLDLGGQGQHRFIVRTRDLAPSGIGFIHSKPSELGSPCRIVLMSRARKLVQRDAVVASCRQHQDVYVIGIRLEKPIEPDEFIAPPDEVDSSMWIS
jgi:hypothetical protein